MVVKNQNNVLFLFVFCFGFYICYITFCEISNLFSCMLIYNLKAGRNLIIYNAL